MNKKGEMFFGAFAALFLVAIFIYLSWKFIVIISAASDNVKAAAITALFTVFTFVLGKYFEQSRERKAKVNAEKIRIYEKFFAAYFHIFSNEKFRDETKPTDWALKEIIGLQKELIMWGSDSVLKEYLNFKIAITSFGARNSNVDGSVDVEGLAVVISSVAGLLKAMRRDIGYRFTTFNGQQLAVLQMNAGEPEFPALLKAIKKQA